MTALATLREAPGLEEYLDALEERLARAVATHPGVVAQVGNEALAAGGKPVGTLGGGFSADQLTRAGCVRVASNLAEMLAMLRSLARLPCP